MFIESHKLDEIKAKNYTQPSELLNALMRGFLGKETLKSMNSTGRERREPLPKDVIAAVKS